MREYRILLVVLSFIMMISTMVLMIIYKRRKNRYEEEVLRLSQEKELFNYYLKNEIPKETNERYINNFRYFRESNFEHVEQVLYEITRLRRDINKLSDKSNRLYEEKAKSGKNVEEFNYIQLIEQLSHMTNIQYLFDMLNHDQEEKMVYVKNVLADIVHTIRNPVSGIRALIEIIRIEDLDSDLLDKVQDIENYIGQIEENLNAYYEISHMTVVVQGDDHMVNLEKEIHKRSRLLILSSGKIINVRVNDIEIQVERKVAEVILLGFTCILENAISFSPDNGEIVINIEYEQGQITLGIENSGPIIEKDVLAQIFNQGFSTRGSSGRGLAIAKRAIEEILNGVVICENIGEARGVKFTIIAEVRKNDEQSTVD